MGSLDGLCRNINGCVKTKRARYHVNIIINGFGNSNNTDLQVPFGYGIRYFGGSHEGSITTDHKKDADVYPFQAVDNLVNRLGSP